MQEELNNILKSFKINAECVTYNKVRNISLYGLTISPGTRINTLYKYSEEIALALHSKSKLSFKIMPETSTIQIEATDELPSKISLLKELTKISPPKNCDIPIYLGSSVSGNDIWTDLARNPHILIAGSTGSGKSVLLHTIITNLLLLSYSRVFVIDTKGLDFVNYARKFNNISVYDTYQGAYEILKYLTEEMDFRYSLLRENMYSVNNFNPYVLIIDEFADLIMQDDKDKLYNLICSLTQRCRAAGIYCIVATQRPSIDIIRGTIKANIPARISCKVATKTDSRVILDRNGAELLAGNGDAIINNYNNDYVRFQAAFTDSKEVLDAGK